MILQKKISRNILEMTSSDNMITLENIHGTSIATQSLKENIQKIANKCEANILIYSSCFDIFKFIFQIIKSDDFVSLLTKNVFIRINKFSLYIRIFVPIKIIIKLTVK